MTTIPKGRRPRVTTEGSEEAKDLVAKITLLSRWNQRELADVMGVTPQTITNWMSGHRCPDTLRMTQLRHMATRIENSVKKRKGEARRAAMEVENATDIL